MLLLRPKESLELTEFHEDRLAELRYDDEAGKWRIAHAHSLECTVSLLAQNKTPRKLAHCTMCSIYLSHNNNFKLQTDRQTDRQTNRQTDRQTYKHTYIHTYILTYRNEYIQTICLVVAFEVKSWTSLLIQWHRLDYKDFTPRSRHLSPCMQPMMVTY